MKTMTSLRAVTFALSLVAGGSALFMACSSSNTNPTPGTGGSTVVGSSSSSSGSTSSSSGTGGNTGTGGSTTGSTGCYDGGMPMTNDQFLNACGATCQTYPNSTLPGLSADGGLPALP